MFWFLLMLMGCVLLGELILRVQQIKMNSNRILASSVR